MESDFVHLRRIITMDYKVVVLGVDHHNALGLVRSLGRVGINCDAILTGPVVDGYVLESKYIHEGRRCGNAEEAVSYLLKRYQKESVVVMTASDDVAVAIDEAYGSIPSNIKTPNAKGRLPYLISKQVMCNLAEEVGLNVPVHIVYEAGAELPEDIVFPCITKAISSVDGTKADTHICQTKTELSDILLSNRTCHTLIIEQFVDKLFEFQFIGLSINSGDEIIIPGHSHIVWPDIENTNYFPYKANDNSFQDTLNKAKEFIRKTEYSGFFSVEFLRGKDGKDYFLEMNFRNDGNAICATDSGYNLPYIWYLYNTGGDYISEIKNSYFHEVNYCPEIECTYQMLEGKISLSEWWVMIRKSKSYTIFCPGDNRPFWNNVRANIRGFVSSIVKRVFQIKR